MTAVLTANTPRMYVVGEDFDSRPVKASTSLFEGQYIGASGGYMRALVAGDAFRGIADRHADNSAGADGAVNIRIRKRGVLTQAVISGLAVTDLGAPIYASDDNTLTKTASGNSFVGFVSRFISSGIGEVTFNVGAASGAVLSALTDSTGGTPSTTLAVITAGGSYAQADLVAVKNAISSLAAQINALQQVMK